MNDHNDVKIIRKLAKRQSLSGRANFHHPEQVVLCNHGYLNDLMLCHSFCFSYIAQLSATRLTVNNNVQNN